MKKVAILAKYKEQNHFWRDLLSENYEVLIYNKFDGENLLPNVGREGHTYLHYIVENYNNLPDEILFSQYDPSDHFSGNRKIHFSDAMKIFLNKNLINFCGIRACDFDLIVRKRKIDWIEFSKEFFGKFEHEKILELVACGATLNGVFRVTKDSILKHDISLYKKAVEMLSRGSDPYEGYYFERMWKFIFIETGCKNPEFSNFNDRIFLFGTNDRNFKFPQHVRLKLYNFGHIKLSKDGTIRSNGNVSYYHHYNESHWLIKNNFLYLIDACGAATSRFDISNNDLILLGDIKSDSGEWHEKVLTLSNPFWQ